MKFTTITSRIYADYFMPGRLSEYEAILKYAKDAGYATLSVIQYFDLLKNAAIKDETRLLVLRHDIDSDTETARKFFEIERKHKACASYYFRLCTLEPGLMKEIVAFGSEASYHYEELATYCKRERIRTADKLMQAMPSIQAEFVRNFDFVKQMVNVRMRSVASHGDWLNRYLRVANWQLLTREVRERCSIEVECYDEVLKKDCLRISDTLYPTYWKQISPVSAMQNGIKVVYLLTHPRHWVTNYTVNTKENYNRLWEEVKYRL